MSDTPIDRELCTLDDVKRYLPGYDPDDDTEEVLQELISSLSVDTYHESGREFVTRGDNPPRLFDVTWWEVEQRELEIGDLAKIDGSTVVEILAEDLTVLQTLNAAAYIGLPRSRDSWEPITTLRLPRLVQAPADPALLRFGYSVRVTGAWGFPEIPKNVRESVAKLVIVRYLTDVGDQGTGLTDALANINIAGLFKSATESLERYRTPSVG